MATTTPNFGWPVPTSTDLVKDGATAIEALGDAIDASMLDFKGGTTGQVLSKTSATDMDFTWTSPNPGDITGVTAGTGISGGGTSGDVTITNSMATAIDAKGDLIAGTGADAFSRLAVGATGGMGLMVDSTAATGLVWKGAISASVYNSTAFVVANTTFTTLTFDSESWDTDSMHSTVTNTSRITVPKTGYYRIELQGIWQGSATGGRGTRFLNNGSSIFTQFVKSDNGDYNYYFPYTAKLTANDYVEAQVYQDSGGNLTWYNRSQDGMFLVTWIGA
jgi:CheY-specific phosphatase CheX